MSISKPECEVRGTQKLIISSSEGIVMVVFEFMVIYNLWWGVQDANEVRLRSATTRQSSRSFLSQ